ncbi:MAG TPA: hypothetical protein VKP08_07490, partial [Anaerolineales bacterium]|nr:hypothetical protein [Anaerolineales bacterium]
VSSNLEEYHQSLDGQQQDMMTLTDGSIRKGTNWLLDQREDAWSTLKGSRLRVATTAKSIIALLDHSRPQDIYNSKNQLGDAFRWALEQHDTAKGGFPATTLQPYSTSIVHCTGMAIYAYVLLCEAGFLDHDENSDEAKRIKQAVNWLLQIKQPEGWGNWEGQPVRPLSSYWALRALKRISLLMVPECPIDFASELNAFSKLLDLQKSQKTESLATSCFFLTLIDELKVNLSEYPRLELLAHESVGKLFRKRLPEDGLWFDELEQFNIMENNQVALVSHWTHHITALAIHALSVNQKLLEGRNDQMELLYESILALINTQKLDGNFDFVPPNINNKITPTYESLNSLHKVLDNLF